MIGGRMDFLSQMNQKLIKSADIVVDVPSFENGFSKEKKRVRQEIWDYVQYRESLVKWPPTNEKIKMGLNPNHQ
jgi:precorrin isomerase